MNRFSADSPIRLDSFLSEKTGKSRSFIQEQIKKGRVSVNNSTVSKASHKLKPDDSVYFEPVEEPKLTHLIPTPGKLEILYEDEHLIAINKSAGIIVHPGAGQKENTLVHHLVDYLKTSHFLNLSSERPGIVHRLDQGTTGVLLVAKNEATQQSLSDLFKARTIKKTYHAIAWGKMNLSGTIDSPIGRDLKDRKKMSSRTQRGRIAITQWKAIERFSHFTHVALFPQTGRTHQLRVHLSENKFPIVGDPTYGRGKTRASLIANPLTEWLSQLDHTLLHAYSLEFIHPVTNTLLHICAPLPADFTEFLNLLKEYDSCPR